MAPRSSLSPDGPSVRAPVITRSRTSGAAEVQRLAAEALRSLELRCDGLVAGEAACADLTERNRDVALRGRDADEADADRVTSEAAAAAPRAATRASCAA